MAQNKTRRLYCGMPTIQYSAGLKRSAICALAIYFLHSMRPSVTWLNSRWWLAACDWVMSALSTVFVNRRRTSQIIWGGFLYRPGEWVWIDSNGKNGN